MSSRVYFTPGEACQQAIIDLLSGARKSIDICVFTISDNDIADALVACHRRGLPLRIITDNDKQHDRGSDVGFLHEAGIPVRMDRSEHHMHHKFALIDGHTLLTGSYNWTRSAYRFNYENILITKEKEAVRQYQAEFDRLWSAFKG
jgi:phosphatidylserine/phosphatidylglycerophosphate/cardiolipin synthase-like enzyme